MTDPVITKLTHKGWFGICPAYFGDLDRAAPLVVERHVVFVPLMWLSELLFALCSVSLELIDPTSEPNFPLLITGELAAPLDHIAKEHQQ